MDQPPVIVVRHGIKAATVVKVVVVGTIAAYFARNLVKAIDDSFIRVTVTKQTEDDKK